MVLGFKIKTDTLLANSEAHPVLSQSQTTLDQLRVAALVWR